MLFNELFVNQELNSKSGDGAEEEAVALNDLVEEGGKKVQLAEAR